MLFFLITDIILVLVIVLLIKIFLRVVNVEGASMSPTFEEGQQVLILLHIPTKLLRRDQFAVFNLSWAETIPDPKPSIIIKRIVGLPNNIVRIQGSQIEQWMPFKAISTRCDDGFYELQVPLGHCFVRADGTGADSRHWGPIPLHALVGIVVKRMSKPDVRKREI